jgi:hypothetical protein
MNSCFFSLKRMLRKNEPDNTETEDQNIIRLLDEITKQISQLTEISSLFNGRINNLEVEVKFLKLRRNQT